MTGKKTTNNDVETLEKPVATPVLFTSKQEVADELKMSVNTFSKYLRRYPFKESGVSGKVMGRWRVTQEYVWRWHDFVMHQDSRHPDSRRLRPEEPPGSPGSGGGDA